MLRLPARKTVLRAATLALLIAAFLGPWWLDPINVPAQYTCSSPAIRLEGDFCGIPMAGTSMLYMMGAAPIGEILGLVTGANAAAGIGLAFTRSLLASLLLLSFVLPFVTTVLLMRHGESPRQRVLHIGVWGLAASAGLFIGLSSHPRLFWVLWGVWLYVGAAASALIMELLMTSKRICHVK